MNFENPLWRSRPLHTALRVLKSLVRRRIAPLRSAVVPYDEGRSRIVADLSTSLGLKLYRYGHGEPEIELVRRVLRPGDRFVDGGANIGLFTLVAAASVGPTGEVVAFEPADRTRRILQTNVALNSFDWVTLRSEALDQTSGSRSFIAFAGNSAGLSSFAPQDQGAPGSTSDVSTVALDDVIREDRRDRLALIKLDLEGAEYAALLGASALLRDVAPDFMIELEPEHLSRQRASAKQVVELFTTHGYRFYRVRREASELALVREQSPAEGGHSPNDSPNLYVAKTLARVEAAGVHVIGER